MERVKDVVSRKSLVSALTVLTVLGLNHPPRASHAAVESQHPAAIVVFPWVVADGAARDTVIEMANTSSSAATMQCIYVNAGDCLWRDFVVRLTPRQALKWRVSEGMLALPHPENSGSVPPAVIPFRGELKCVEVNNDGEPGAMKPAARNDLIGAATIVDTSSGRPDVATYTAIGIESTGVNDQDQRLCLGEGASCPVAEYQHCPAVLVATHFGTGAAVSGRTVDSDLLLVPCSEDLETGVFPSSQVNFLIFNEFEQQFGREATITCAAEVPVFPAAIAGSPTLQTRMRRPSPSDPGQNVGLLGVVVERHMPSGQGAAFGLTGAGASQEDVVSLPPAF